MSIPFTAEYMASEPYFGDDVWETDEAHRTTQAKNDGGCGQDEETTTNPRDIMDHYDAGTGGPIPRTSNNQRAVIMSQGVIGDFEMASEHIAGDRAKYSFFSIALRIIAMRIYRFANEFKIVGIYKLAERSNTMGSVIRKIIWRMLLLFGVGFMAFQIYEKVSYYHSWPTTVSYQFAYNRSLRFPTVTVCPETLVARKAVEVLGHDLAEVVSQVWPPFPDVDFHPNYKIFNSSTWDVDWEQFYIGVAPPNKEILLECQFRNAPCNSAEALQTVITDFGLCFSFNPSTANYVTSEPGAIQGLHLVLWTNQSDSLVTMSPAAGFRMVLHDPSETPIVQSIGFNISPGTLTSVSFTFKNISQLPAPYGSCCDDQNYAFMGCMTDCEGKFLKKNCNCRPVQLQVSGPVCNPEQYAECALAATKAFISSGASRKCDCPLQCLQHKYPYSISASRLSDQFLNNTQLMKTLKERKLNLSRLSRELIFLDVFYTQLTYVDIQTFAAYSILDLVCDTGGAFGLILGGSVLSLFQIIQLVIQLIGDVKLAYIYSRMKVAA